MEKNYDETLEPAEDLDFYRDSFGERITREGDDTLPGDEEALAADDSTVTDEDETMPAVDEDFRERLDQTDPTSDMDGETPAAMDQSDGDFEASSPSEPSMGDKIRDKFNDLTGDERR